MESDGCSRELSQLGFKKYITLSDQAPWIAKVSRNIVEGYQIEVCIQCKTKYQTIQFDNWEIKQNRLKKDENPLTAEIV